MDMYKTYMSKEYVSEFASCFYSVSRAGAQVLSDDGGPFGFDAHAAIAFDLVFHSAEFAEIVETGTALGDTTEYLCKRYPDVSIVSIENSHERAEFARKRLRKYGNLQIIEGNSSQVLGSSSLSAGPTLYYLDAHGDEQWPLKCELRSVEDGVAMVDDVKVPGRPWHFDTYGTVDCDYALLRSGLSNHPQSKFYTISGQENFPLPCLQMKRRAGKALVGFGSMTRNLEDRPTLVPLEDLAP